MTKKMLIDASHPEETRVVVLDGNRLEDFDLETQNKRPLKGNIYLAKVVRVEPSLQAAFVEYGGNRHGFLAFSEIHPDYYQIPVADRQRLLEMQAAEARDYDDEDEDAPSEKAVKNVVSALEQAADALDANDPEGIEAALNAAFAATREADEEAEAFAAAQLLAAAAEPPPETEGCIAEEAIAPAEPAAPVEPEPVAAAAVEAPASVVDEAAEEAPAKPKRATRAKKAAPAAEPAAEEAPAKPKRAPRAKKAAEPAPEAEAAEEAPAKPKRAPRAKKTVAMSMSDEVVSATTEQIDALEPPPETLGGRGREERDDRDDERQARIPPRFLRHYKIQEVIRRRQIMLVQVVKEERGNKGAALTTYISLAGRFSVLMPNSPRGGGVSRKITSVNDRKRLREVIDELNLPNGMSLIVRTAGAQRPKPEIRRDCEYLLRLWDDIRERTMESTAPALVYEEADLIKRSIRDVYGRDVEEIQIEGDEAWQHARDFMRMLMPQHEKKIRLYRDNAQPLFARYGVEAQLDAMMSPVVQLKSGGYIVINQTEALVAIDVNSGRATRDRHIEDTALRTNCEAADEIARQLRLRDMAGLIVIDFIDMESSKNDAQVERRLKEALKDDRARIQVGRISHFGLLEMSRQRLRPSVTEHSFMTCPHCQGRGIVRSPDSAALQVIRAIEEEGARRRASEITVHVAHDLALHILNRKRERLQAIEARYGLAVIFEPSEAMSGAAFRIEKTKARVQGEEPAPSNALRMSYEPEAEEAPRAARPMLEAEAVEAPEGEAKAERRPEANGNGEGEGENGEGRRRRRRRRRRGGRREDGTPQAGAEGVEGDEGDAEGEDEGEEAPAGVTEAEAASEAAPAPQETAEPVEEIPAGAPSAESEAALYRRNRDRRNQRGRGGRFDGEQVAREPRELREQRPPQAPRQPAPRYAGPTPADPFAGTLDDIFDAMAKAEEAAEEAARRPAAPVAAAPVQAPVEPVAPAQPAAVVEPVVIEPVKVEPIVAEAPAETPAPEAPAPEAAPEPEPAASEPVAGPVVQPKVIGEGNGEAPARRGWWRR
ncbi:Rne/Rng family ribonuclease [Acetobacteraceae bacterium H6797]|nr:Rne/Rng family ribonuclease [Acetobacteraceae bacterium H6797]